MNTYELIKKKRDGLELSRDELSYLINGFVGGQIPDYQMSAFLMSVYFSGMSPRECSDLTMLMVESGDTIDLSNINGFTVDKHSTGGVGDTTTLILAPLVAASGGIVAKMTGRELGHTGGTVDKLDAIPNMKTDFSKERFVEIANSIHVSVIAQTASLAPADKYLYALRNVTATVDSIPLISASIMSKKLAAGADGIVLDVKFGNGSFMQKYDDAIELAETMVGIGENAGRKVVALITSMDQPLGYAIGNGLEVQEAIDTLNGHGPQDLVDLVVHLGSNMLAISGVSDSYLSAKEKLQAAIRDKKGLHKLGELIEAQGGNPEVIYDSSLLPQAKQKVEINSEKEGIVEKINAMEVGLVSKLLGAGRQTKEDSIDLSTGIVLKKKIGDPVKKSEPLAVIYSNGDNSKIKAAREKFLNAYTIGNRETKSPKLIYARVTANGVEKF